MLSLNFPQKTKSKTKATYAGNLLWEVMLGNKNEGLRTRNEGTPAVSNWGPVPQECSEDVSISTQPLLAVSLYLNP